MPFPDLSGLSITSLLQELPKLGGLTTSCLNKKVSFGLGMAAGVAALSVGKRLSGHTILALTTIAATAFIAKKILTSEAPKPVNSTSSDENEKVDKEFLRKVK